LISFCVDSLIPLKIRSPSTFSTPE